MVRNQELVDLINSQGFTEAADNGDFAGIATALNSPTIQKTDSTRRVMDDLIDVVGATNANTVLESLSKAGCGEIPELKSVAQLCASEWHNLSGIGSDVSRPGLQSLLASLGLLDGWPEGLASGVAAMGRWLVSPIGEEQTDAAELRGAWRAYRLNQRITNATANAGETITADMSGADIEAAWANAWANATAEVV